VVLVGRTPAKLTDVEDEIVARGGYAQTVRCDVAVPQEIDAAVSTALARFGRLDILINAAHHNTRGGRLLTMADQDIELLWATGPRATLQFMRACHPHLCGGGSIINFGSGTQLNPVHYGVYAAMKEAIRSLSRTAAVEWGADGIRVNVIAPLAESPSMDAHVPEHRRGALVRSIPLGRVGDPEADIGPVAVFLASDAAAYVTGQFLLLDGGQTYHR